MSSGRFKINSIVKCLFVLGIISIIYSCNTLKNSSIPTSVKTPENFIADTSGEKSIAQLSIKQLFQDSLLVELIEYAIKNNPDVLIALQRIEMARANYLLSKGLYKPFVSLDASAGVTRYSDHTMDGVGNFDTNLSPNVKGTDKKIPDPVPDYFLGLKSSWEIDIWGKLRNHKRAAAARMLATEHGKNFVITSLVASISENYFTLMILDQELEIVRNNILLQEKAVETIKFLKEGGRTNELAVKQASAQLLNTRALEFMIKQDIIAVENNLNFLLGRFPSPIPRSSILEQDHIKSVVSPGVPSVMLLRRPDIREAEQYLRASEFELQSARAAFLPSLNLTGFTGYNSFDANVIFNPGSIVFGIFSGLTTPVFQGNRIKSNYRYAKASNYESYYNYQKVILKGFAEVNSNIARINNYQNILDLKTEEVETLHAAVVSSNDLFRSGYASYLEVIVTQKNVLEAEIALINARKEQYMAIVELYRSLGGGWE